MGLSFRAASPEGQAVHGRECWTVQQPRWLARARTFAVHAKALKGTSGTKTNHATAAAKGVKGAEAKATVRVKPAPRAPGDPVTG